MNKIIGFDKEFNKILDQLINNNLNNSILVTGIKGIGKNYFLNQLIKEYIKSKFNEQNQNHLSLFYNNSHPNIRILEKEIDPKTKKVKNFITINQIRMLYQFSLETSLIDNMSKFIIINSADDLNVNSSNALLKILEEPNINSYFFLISHKPSTLLPTIKSRCLKINLITHNFDNFNRILQIRKPDIDDETAKFLFDITNGSPGLSCEYDFENILEHFDKIIYLVVDNDPFSNLNNEIIELFSSFENEKLKIYLSLIKFILITIHKIITGIDIRKNYLSTNILKIENISNQISINNIQKKLDYLINNENDLFTFNLDKKIFMINFITEK